MLFYGDRLRIEPTRQAFARLEARLGAVDAQGPGLGRHEASVAALMTAAQLLQGVADAEMAAAGQDDATPVQAAGMALLLTLARTVGASWRGGVGSVGEETMAALQR